MCISFDLHLGLCPGTSRTVDNSANSPTSRSPQGDEQVLSIGTLYVAAVVLKVINFRHHRMATLVK